MQKMSTVAMIAFAIILLASLTIKFWTVIKTPDFWLNAGILIGFTGLTFAGIIKFINTNKR